MTKTHKDNEELAKDIAIVAYPETRDFVEHRALLVLNQLELSTLQSIKESIEKAKEKTQEETGSFKYDFVYDEIIELLSKE